MISAGTTHFFEEGYTDTFLLYSTQAACCEYVRFHTVTENTTETVSLLPVFRTRIRIDFGRPDQDLDPGGQNGPQKYKEGINLKLRSAGCSLSRAEGFSYSLDVLYWISKLHFLIIKTLDLDQNSDPH